MEGLDENALMTVIAEGTTAFLRDDLGIEASHPGLVGGEQAGLQVRFITGLTVIGGLYNLTVAVTFDEPLFRRIFEIYTEEIDVPKEEEEVLLLETAGSMVNIIVGNCTPAMQVAGNPFPISISPPVTFRGSEGGIRCGGASLYHSKIKTDLGETVLNFLWPETPVLPGARFLRKQPP